MMKRILPFFTALLLVFACQTKEKVLFEKKSIIEDDCEDCAKVNINIPQALTTIPISGSINQHINDFVIRVLNYSEESRSNTIEEEVAGFKKGYSDLKNQFPDEILGWDASIKGEISYESQDIISIKFDTYMFTGGAHGYGSTSYLNIDIKTGGLLTPEAIFNNVNGFKGFVEEKFRVQENIPMPQNINSTGFMFEGDAFHLPNSIGFTPKGLELIYNAYEISAYSEGAKIIEIPFEEAEPFLKVR